MHRRKKKTSKLKNWLLLILALTVCIGAVGATWAVLSEVTDSPVINVFRQAVEYKLSYNLNGGSGSIADAVYVDAENLASYSFTVTDAEPELENYVFMGWADTADAETAAYHAGDTITLAKATPSKTVYAVWMAAEPEELNDFRLEFNANIPDGVVASVGVPSAMEKKAPGDLYTFNVPNGLVNNYNPDDNGLRFAGWALSEFGDPVYTCSAESPAMSVTVAKGTTTLYAVWEYDWYLSFDRNVSDGSVQKALKNGNAYQDDNAPILVKLNHNTVSVSGAYTESGYVYRRADHMLVGFASSANGKEPLQTVTISKPGKNNALTVYSIWETGSFALVYDANGGKQAPEAQTIYTTADSYTFYVTSKEPLPADTAEATFLGWSRDPEATVPDELYAAGKPVTLTEAEPTLTLYAVWEYFYRLSFAPGNATGGSVPEERVIGPTTAKAVTFDIPLDPVPTRDGYDFDYWAATEQRQSGEHRYYDVANYSRKITLRSDDTNVTMYARMKPTNGVTLNYYNGSSRWDYATITDNTQDFCNFTVTDREPTKTENIFLGWSTSSNPTAGENSVDYRAGDIITINGDEQASMNLYAVWRAYDKIRVRIDFNGGEYTTTETVGSGCNKQEITTYHRSRYGEYETLRPGATSHSFGTVAFEKKSATSVYFPTLSGHTVAGFAYHDNTDGSLVTDITMKDSSLCDSGGVKNIKWNASWGQELSSTTNADGSTSYTLTVYMIWAKNAAKDRYVAVLDQNYGTSGSYTVTRDIYKNQIAQAASGNNPAVINTEHTFTNSDFADSDKGTTLSSMAYNRDGYKLLGFARTKDGKPADAVAGTNWWPVSGSTLQNSVTVRQDDSDVVTVVDGGTDGGNSYKLTLYAAWEREQIYRLYTDFGIGSYTLSGSSYVYNDYTWNVQRPLSEQSYTFSTPTLGGRPSATGFKLLGFSTDPNSTSPEYSLNSSFTLTPAVEISQTDPLVEYSQNGEVDIWTLKLYAIYEKQRLFNLTVDYNGGTYNSDKTRTLTQQASAAEPVYTYNGVGFGYPSRNGYKLLGLARTPDATEAEFTLNSSGTISPGLEYDTRVLTPTINGDGVEVYSQTLYAVWQEQREFTIRFNGNGGSYPSDVSLSRTRVRDTDVREEVWTAGTLTAPTPSKTDYRFLGYAYTQGATVPDFTVSSGKIVEEVVVSENGQYVVNDTSSIPNTTTLTLYAVWEPVKYYQIRLDLGEGTYTNSSGTTLNEIIIRSSGQSLGSSTYTFSNPTYYANSTASRSGYSNYGYTDVEGSTTAVISTPSRTGSSTPYTYTFNSTTVKVTEGEPGVTVQEMESGVTYVTKTYHAIWGTRLYYYNNGSQFKSVSRYYDEAANRVFDITPDVPANKNFTFAGWSTSSSNLVPEYGVSGYAGNNAEPLKTQYTLSDSSSTASLYAVWWQHYTLSFSANGGLENTTPGRDSAYELLKYNSSSTTHTFEILNNVPVYDESNSRAFLGWSTDPNATEPTYSPGGHIEVTGYADGSETPTVLYAVWEAAAEPDTAAEEEEPGTDEPAGDEPGTDEPAGDDPGTDEPAGDEPGTDEPAGDDPGTDEPAGDDPGTDEPAGDEPGTDEPAGEEGAEV